MVDDRSEDGANIHGVGALCQAQGKQFVPASFHQVDIIIVTTGRIKRGKGGRMMDYRYSNTLSCTLLTANSGLVCVGRIKPTGGLRRTLTLRLGRQE